MADNDLSPRLPRRQFWMTASWAEQIYGIRLGRHYLSLAGPKRLPLFSERHGAVRVIWIAGSWRLRLRSDAA